jgi:2-C-methyl-D-erythritol 4-phosphate cytidylyltransferase
MAERDVHALIFAGGTGSRMKGSAVPKQFLEVAGKPIIIHTLRVFESHPRVTDITIVCLPEWIDRLWSMLRKEGIAKVGDIVPGGETGQLSIFNGLESIYDASKNPVQDVVLVHDGVRPLIDASTISACIDSVIRRGPTVTVTPSTETVIIESEDGKVERTEDRSRCGFARAPQAFCVNELYQAHLRAQGDGITTFIDSISMMAHYGYQAYTITGPTENIKITTPADYFVFKAYLDQQDYAQLWSDENDDTD